LRGNPLGGRLADGPGELGDGERTHAEAAIEEALLLAQAIAEAAEVVLPEREHHAHVAVRQLQERLDAFEERLRLGGAPAGIEELLYLIEIDDRGAGSPGGALRGGEMASRRGAGIDLVEAGRRTSAASQRVASSGQPSTTPWTRGLNELGMTAACTSDDCRRRRPYTVTQRTARCPSAWAMSARPWNRSRSAARYGCGPGNGLDPGSPTGVLTPFDQGSCSSLNHSKWLIARPAERVEQPRDAPDRHDRRMATAPAGRATIPQRLVAALAGVMTRGCRWRRALIVNQRRSVRWRAASTPRPTEAGARRQYAGSPSSTTACGPLDAERSAMDCPRRARA
jgi:hypothetical protein